MYVCSRHGTLVGRRARNRHPVRCIRCDGKLSRSFSLMIPVAIALLFLAAIAFGVDLLGGILPSWQYDLYPSTSVSAFSSNSHVRTVVVIMGPASFHPLVQTHTPAGKASTDNYTQLNFIGIQGSARVMVLAGSIEYWGAFPHYASGGFQGQDHSWFQGGDSVLIAGSVGGPVNNTSTLTALAVTASLGGFLDPGAYEGLIAASTFLALVVSLLLLGIFVPRRRARRQLARYPNGPDRMEKPSTPLPEDRPRRPDHPGTR